MVQHSSSYSIIVKKEGIISANCSCKNVLCSATSIDFIEVVKIEEVENIVNNKICTLKVKLAEALKSRFREQWMSY